MRFSFRPILRNDTSLLREWLSTPHFQEWWGDVDEEIELFFDDGVTPFIFQVDDENVGIIQYWDVASTRRYPELTPIERDYIATLKDEDIGIDISIGETSKLNCGIGPLALRAFIRNIVPKTEGDIIIDPDSRNLRAIRAYEKAGFRKMNAFQNGDEAVTILRYEPENE